MPYDPYVPQSMGELLNYLAHMMLAAPTFKDRTGYLPEENVETTFISLNGGLLAVRQKIGEERYATLKAMSDKMRTLFESDPGNKTGDTQAGRTLINEMEDLLTDIARRGHRNSRAKR
jgi:hypothetical protein